MKYPQIISKVLRSFWAITDERHEAIVSALEARLSGASFAVMEDDEGDEESQKTEAYEVLGGVAVIRVHGALGKHLSRMEMRCGGCSMDFIGAMVDIAKSDSNIHSIVFDINSPGGTVTGTPELARKIAQCGKPTFAFTDSECCSGALWLASQCDHFHATESAIIGSVGVRMILMDYTKALEDEGIKVNAISSGKYKLTGAYFKPLEPDEREMLQAESDRIHEQFKAAVTSKRKVAEEHMQGQIFRGEQALACGFIDGLMDDLEMVVANIPVDSRSLVNGI